MKYTKVITIGAPVNDQVSTIFSAVSHSETDYGSKASWIYLSYQPAEAHLKH